MPRAVFVAAEGWARRGRVVDRRAERVGSLPLPTRAVGPEWVRELGVEAALAGVLELGSARVVRSALGAREVLGEQPEERSVQVVLRLPFGASSVAVRRGW